MCPCCDGTNERDRVDGLTWVCRYQGIVDKITAAKAAHIASLDPFVPSQHKLGYDKNVEHCAKYVCAENKQKQTSQTFPEI